ncbi:hypothetical protein PR048_011407 [Dryococelus australis]|uniref:HAT C-terminal dimerisation domain-containing protein n=1 Tax=Dryococelus australis TaxID=614101 RepID=A0ABQ9HLH5_9NEOP|nr:hypothetical protein PR048_011407 [Dryococelus australis]
MAKMREELARKDINDGCSAYLLNLPAHNLQVINIMEHIKQIVKYFRNIHLAATIYKQAGGTTLALPTADCVESYLNNWYIIAKLRCTMMIVPLAKAWKFGLIYMIFSKIKIMTVTDELNYFMKLTEEQIHSAVEYVLTYHPDAVPDLIKYKAKCSPFKDYLFSPTTLKEIKPLKSTHRATLYLAHQLHSAVASSAGTDRQFSTFRYVHSSVRNRLGTEKAAKLVTVFCALNNKNIT